MFAAKQNGTAKSDVIAVENPITLQTIGTIPVSTAEQIAEMVEAARVAQPAWAALGAEERSRVLQAWGDALWSQQREGMRVIREETGKPESGAILELLVVDGTITYFAQHGPAMLKPQRRRTSFPVVQWGRTYYKPHGVVGIISPWNYPFLLPFVDAIPALLAGNAVILKPSEVTPFSAEWGLRLLYEAGMPRGVIQIAQGDGRTGAALVEQVDYIHFTGSTEVGRKVAQSAARRLIPFSMELGGKDACIVLDDADLDMTATGVMRGAFENAGQACISIERVYVQAGIYERLIERILHYAPQFIVDKADGMHVHMGSMTNNAELERTEAHIADALAKGARLVYGGKRRPELGPRFFEPTVLVDVDHSMDVMREETFGPVLPIMKVSSIEEAIRLANDNRYGLSGSIFTKDLAQGVAIARRLNTGDVSINRSHMVLGTPSMPSGGQGDSGMGRRNAREGLLKYTSMQSILTDNLLLQKPEFIHADPFTLWAYNLLRQIRRRFPYI